MRNNNIIKSLVVFSLLAILTACGGGGESGAPGSIGDGGLSIPRVVSQFPSADSSASIDTVVTISFDEEIDPASLTAETVQLSGPEGLVTGEISYDSNLNQLSFVPDENLLAYSSYQVTMTSVTDIYGNSFEPEADWNFTTIFDQLPPELPEF